MRNLFVVVITVALSAAAFSQATPPSAFAGTTYNFALTPVTLPGQQQTLSGAETDFLVNFTPNNVFGETTLISTATFVGGRYERIFPSVANWIQNHTSLTGGNFEAGVTTSLGVVKGAKEYWGERAGIFLKYAPSGSQNFNIGIDAEWNNLPGIDPSTSSYGHNVPSIAIGPNFRF